MNENLNLAEILKDCPKGTKLYSPICGEVEFIEIINVLEYSIRCITENSGSAIFSKTGQYISGGECLLFPSKDQRDWSKFKCSKPKFDPNTLKPFDKVLVRDVNDREWNALLFSHISNREKLIVAGCSWEQVIPYNEETKHLVGTSDETLEFYKYWEE